MELISVHGLDDEKRTFIWESMYALLKEREPYQSISHKEVPTYIEHYNFMRNQPYKHWYAIIDNGFIGSIYIGKENNIGLFIKKDQIGKGYGAQALKRIIELHPLDYYLANIAPENSNSIAFFSNFGFKHYKTLMEDLFNEVSGEYINTETIQYTYKFIPVDQ